ncbi:MAG: ABC transporter substrate binding protein, partial [Candidatus Sedimenticola sp. 6PFRAG1]
MPVELYTEYLDTRGLSSSEQLDAVAQVIGIKHSKQPFDLVITSDNPAFDFATTRRKLLFGDIPIVFCGYNYLKPENLKDLKNITGVNEETDYVALTNLILQVHPRTRTLVYITSTSNPTEKILYNVITKDIAPRYSKSHEVVILKNIDQLTLKQRLDALGPQSVVIIAGFLATKKPIQAITLINMTRTIVETSPFPVYSTLKSQLGTGIVGGRVKSGYNQGHFAAEMALKILGGKSADAIEPMMKGSEEAVFDVKALKRFGINMERLPPNARLINRAFSEMTPEEIVWLDKEHTVRVRVTDWPPYQFTQPAPSGIAVDYLDAVARQIGVNIEFIPDSLGWSASTKDLAGPKEHYDLILTMSRTSEREKLYAFTNNYLSSPRVIYARKDSPYILGIDSLSGKTVAAEKGFVSTKRLKDEYPKINLLEVATSEDALRMVAIGEADAYVGNLNNAGYIIKKQAYQNLVVAAPTPFKDHTNAMAVRKDWPELASLINKGLTAMTPQEQHVINEKWGTVEIRTPIDYTLVWQVLGAALLVLTVVFYWNWTLQRARKEADIARQNADTSKRELETIIKNLPTVFYIKDTGGRYLMGNRSWEETAGKKMAEMIGKSDDELNHLKASDHANEVDGKVLQESITINFEEYYPHPDGTKHNYLTTKAPLLDTKEKPYALITISTDITKLKEIESELKQAKEAAEAANQAKSAFLANMSHELRTPLNAVLGFSELMSSDRGLSDQHKNNLEIIHRSGHHLLQLINDVLDMSKIEAGKTQLETEDIDLGELILDVADMVRVRAEQKGLQLLLDQTSDFPRFVRGDGPKIRQILINLLSNSVKFTDQGGVTLRLDAKNGNPDWITLRGEVQDTGRGIESEDIERIFRPFEQLSSTVEQRGTGLGLAITRQFVELMDGEVSAASQPGKGSTFYFSIRVEPGSPDQIEAIEEKVVQTHRVIGLRQPGQEWRILIAEDVLENQVLLQQLLEQAGFQVRIAEDGLETIKLFEAWHPHFIWMDRRMPRLGGLEATQR